jgi:SanA protein
MFIKLILILIIAGLAVFGLPRLFTSLLAGARTYSITAAPQKQVAVVFGAGLGRDGSPSPVLRDRVATAAELYFSNKVEKLLMSGDNRFIDYNEPGAMHDYARSLGVPEEAIVLDYAGRSTYDTCYRAIQIFGVQNAILVTQKFHLPRALFLCRQFGISAVGVPADRRQYSARAYFYWQIREFPATVAAAWEAWISHPLPVLGKPEPIFPPEAH